MSNGDDLEDIRPEKLNELKETILRWIERLSQQTLTSIDDRMVGAARIRAYYDFLREIEAKLKTFEETF